MPLCERVEGLSLGCRTLSTLVLALIVAVGREAVSSLVLLLHVAEEQCADVAEDLRAHAFYGCVSGSVHAQFITNVLSRNAIYLVVWLQSPQIWLPTRCSHKTQHSVWEIWPDWSLSHVLKLHSLH